MLSQNWRDNGREAGLGRRVSWGDGQLGAAPGVLMLAGLRVPACPRCGTGSDAAGAGAAAVPDVPLQQVADEELSRHFVLLIANETAPSHQYLICVLQGHVLCKRCCESKYSAAMGFSTARCTQRGDLLTAPHPNACTVQCEDTSHRNLQHMKYMPGKIIEMMRIILFSCSCSCTPHAAPVPVSPSSAAKPLYRSGGQAGFLAGRYVYVLTW